MLRLTRCLWSADSENAKPSSAHYGPRAGAINSRARGVLRSLGPSPKPRFGAALCIPLRTGPSLHQIRSDSDLHPESIHETTATRHAKPVVVRWPRVVNGAPALALPLPDRGTNRGHRIAFRRRSRPHFYCLSCKYFVSSLLVLSISPVSRCVRAR